MKDRSYLFALALLICALAGCGTPGAPVPPSLELPAPPQDLQAVRKGSKVTLTWTPPSQTTDRLNIRAKWAGPTIVCEAVDQFPVAGCVNKLGELPASAPPLGPKPRGRRAAPLAPGTPKNEFTVTLPESLQRQHVTGWATFAVETENSRGRSAGLSNQVRVPLAPTLPAPTNVSAEVTPAGVVVRWCMPELRPTPAAVDFVARIYRQQEGAAPVAIGEEPPGVFRSACGAVTSMTDATIEWEKKYRYWVAPVTRATEAGSTTVAQVEGEDSAYVTVFTHDVFPPAVPGGLQAVASGVGQRPFVDLTWAPSTDADLAGYNIYRQEQGGAWAKINAAPVLTPSYRDESVAPGKTYNYAVSAVDLRGNESARSGPSSESVP